MATPNTFAADLDINFDRNVFTNDVNLLEGEAAIRRAVKSLILLKPNEKPFHPEIDSGISGLLFENVDPIVVMEIKNRIKIAIKRFEPRVDGLDVDVKFDYDNNSMVVKVLYTIRNIQKVFTTNVVLERIR